MKYINKLLAIAAFSLISLSTLLAQNQIIIQSVLIPPYPVYYSDITTMPGLATVIVQNTDMNNSYTLRFRMKLDGGNGVSLLLSEEVIPSNPISIGPGEVKTLTGDDFANIYHGIGLEDLVVTGVSEKSVLQSQRIPDGLYKLCVQAFSNENVKPLSGYEPTGCSNKMQIITIEPPVILSPLDEAEITATDPQQILMRWTTVNSATAAMLYDIRIAEVPEGVSAYEAMRSDNLLFFEELDYPATVFSYGPSFPSLVSGKNYALQIKAHDATDNANIRNDGKSEIVVFNYLQANKASNLSFNCNGPCLSPPRPSSKIPLENLVAGDEVRIGHFHMTILRASKIGKKFSGEAILDVSSFFTVPILLEFDNLMINSNYEVTTGTAVAKQKPALSSIGCYQDAEGFIPQSDQDMAEIYNAIINPNSTVTTYMNNVSSSSAYSGTNLPLGYGNSGKEMVIIGMYFTSTGATMNSVSGYQMAGDVNTGVINLVYGINNVCISPGGPTNGAGTNDVVLLNAVDFHPNANMVVRFEPGNMGANTGCYARINCSGISEFHIRGTVAMSRANFLPEDANGNLIAGKSLGASFYVNTLNPINWIANMVFEGTTTLPNVEITPHLRINSLADYSFTIKKMSYDNSLYANPSDLNLSRSDIASLGEAKAWKGVYIKDFDLLMPNYFNKNDSNRIAIIGRNFIYDENGYSFNTSGRNLLEKEKPGTFDDWEFTISGYYIRVVHSELQHCILSGEIRLDIANDYIRYRAQMTVNNDDTKYFLRVSPGQRFKMDMWKASLILASSSIITGSVINSDINAEADLTGRLFLNEKIEGIEYINFNGLSFSNLMVYSHDPWLENGHFSLDNDEGQKFGGFDISIDSLYFLNEPRLENIARKSINFNLKFAFGDSTGGFSSDANIKIIGKKTTADAQWGYDSIRVGDIDFHGENSVVKADGILQWIQNDPVYGNGYRGMLDAYFFEDYLVEAQGLFGANAAYDYMYIDGSVIYHEKIPLLSSMGIIGLGGGYYNNMKVIGNYKPMTIGEIKRKAEYRPRKGYKGYKGLFVFTSDYDVFNGIAQVEAVMNDDVLEKLYIDTDFGMLRPLPIGEDAHFEDPMIQIKGRFTYDGINGNNKYLDAQLGYKYNIPINPSFVWAENLNLGTIEFHDSGDEDWYLRIGKPSRMINSHLGIRYKLFGKTEQLSLASANLYFDIGTVLPAMQPFPRNAPRSLNSIYRTEPSSVSSSGVMFGTHIQFGMPKKRSFTVLKCGINFSAAAGLGYDLAVEKKTGVLCNGNSDFGIYKWRADGQGYLYGFADLDGVILGYDFNIAGAGFSTAMKTILPNPTYFGAAIQLHLELPIVGGYNMKTNFTTGSTCEYTLDTTFSENFYLKDLVESIDLSKTVDSVYAFDNEIYADVKTIMPIGRVNTIYTADGTVIRTKLMYQASLYEKISDAETNTIISTPEQGVFRTRFNDNLKISGSGKNLRIYLTDNLGNPLLLPDRQYGVKIRAIFMYSENNGSYRIVQSDNNKPASDVQYVRFFTKKQGQVKITNVIAANPAINQRFFYLGENTSNNTCYLQYSNDRIFDAYGERSNLKVEFVDVGSGEVFSSIANKVSNQNKISYNLPTGARIIAGRRVNYGLRNGRIYEVKVYIRAYSNGAMGDYFELYKYYFRTSDYGKYADKLADIQISYRTYYLSQPTYKYVKLNIKATEGFGIDEYISLGLVTINKVDGTVDPWKTQYNSLRNYVHSHNIRLYSVVSEFLPNLSRYNYLGDITLAEINDVEQNGYNFQNNRVTQLQINWKLNENLYGYWTAVKSYKWDRFGKTRPAQAKMTPYITSPSIGNVELMINNSTTTNFSMSLNYRVLNTSH